MLVLLVVTLVLMLVAMMLVGGVLFWLFRQFRSKSQ